MPRAGSPQLRAARTRKAIDQLAGKGLQREDSDDELGSEDHIWTWIYADNDTSGQRSIIGARHGSGFQCKLGDVVLLKAEGERQAWVGIVCEFGEDEDEEEKLANFMWFSTEQEIRNRHKKRDDFLYNELYITPAWDMNSLNSINGSAQIMSYAKFTERYPEGRIPKRESEKTFICRRACNTRTATYSAEFNWEDIYSGERRVAELIEYVKSHTKATRKRRSHVDEAWDDSSEHHNRVTTPSKRRKLSEPPSRAKVGSRTPLNLTTPTSKRIVVKKPLEFTPLGTRVLTPASTILSPFQVARTRLHVSSVPAALPCREEAFATVYGHLEAAISDGSGSCIYISGTPGTGKTATVREVVAQLNAAVQEEELDDFIFVEINGMKLTDPYQSYSLLWEALRGERVSPLHAVDLLEREFKNPGPRRVPCVVLMDELDQLVTKNQSVMYNFFNWPGLLHSRLIVLAVANTMDLPERTLSNKISSRIGLTRISFPGYTHEQLMKIIQSRLAGVPGDIVDADAIQFASRKVAAVSGDARRALDICRRAVEIAETENLEFDMPETPSHKHKTAAVPIPADRTRGRVVIATIKQAIAEATSGPLQQYLRSQPLACKILLAAFLAKTRRTGLQDGNLGDVIDEAKRMCQLSDDHAIKSCLISGVQNEKTSRGITRPRLPALGLAAMELAEAGVIGMEVGKGERSGKIRLIAGEEELRLAFKDDREVRSLGFA